MSTLTSQIAHAGIALAYTELHSASTIDVRDSEGLNWSSATALAGVCEALRGLLDAIEIPSPTEGSPLIMAVADALDERDAHEAARLVRDTDPDDDIWNNYVGPMLDELEEAYTNSAGEIARDSTTCDECDEPATSFWPKLTPPVQMCDSCAHNAHRSGWVPGVS